VVYGMLLTNLAESKDTNGAFFLMEATAAPGTEPPPHVHTREDELFYLLQGEVDMYDAAGKVIETHEYKGDFKQW